MKALDKFKHIKSGALLAVLAAACLVGSFLLPSPSQSAMTDEEKRVSAILSAIAGAGDTRVSIYYQGESGAWTAASRRAVGAVIVSEGARDVKVKIDLMTAAKALLGLPLDAIEVFLMEEARCWRANQTR